MNERLYFLWYSTISDDIHQSYNLKKEYEKHQFVNYNILNIHHQEMVIISKPCYWLIS